MRNSAATAAGSLWQVMTQKTELVEYLPKME